MLEGVWMINYTETDKPTGIYIKLSNGIIFFSCNKSFDSRKSVKLSASHSAVFRGLIEQSIKNELATYTYLYDLYDAASTSSLKPPPDLSTWVGNLFSPDIKKINEKFDIAIKRSQIIDNIQKTGYQMSLTEIECHGDIQSNNTKTKEKNKREELSSDQLRASETISIWYTGDQYSFCYNPNELNLIGRKKELDTLVDWADAKQKIGMYAIFGESGCGKSRLAFELCRELEQKRWNTLWVNQNTDETELRKLIDNTDGQLLLVFDDVQFCFQFFSSIVSFLRTKLDNNCKLSKIRMVVTAYKEFNELKYYNSTHFKDFYNSFKLGSIGEESLKVLIKDYALSQSMSEDDSERLSQGIWNKLLKLSIRDAAPLYARFMADAICKGKDINDWAQKDILEYIIESGNEKIEKELQDIFGFNVSKALRIIRMVATICGNLSFEDLKELMSIRSLIFLNNVDNENFLWDFLERSAMLDPESEVLIGVKPDIVGYYYCQNTLLDKSILSDQEFNQIINFVLLHVKEESLRYLKVMDYQRWKNNLFDLLIFYSNMKKWTEDDMQENYRFFAIRHLVLDWDQYCEREKALKEFIINKGLEKYAQKIELYEDNIFYGIHNSEELEAEIMSLPNDYTAFKLIELTETQILECEKRATEKFIYNYSSKDALSNRNSEIIDPDIIIRIDPKAVSYNGHTLWGLPYGKGTVKFIDGTTYNGLVYKYSLVGLGSFQHLDRQPYSCHLDKYREGQGTYIWADGAKYEGNWHNGLRDGEGTMEYPNGDGTTVVHGTWEKDVYVGDIPEGIDDDKYKVSLNIVTGNPIGSIIDNYALSE